MSDSYLELNATFSIDGELFVELEGGAPPVVEPVLIDKEIVENGTYHATDDSADGYANVTVNVPEPIIIKKSVTENGTYQASEDNADGYSEVVVDVEPNTITKTITENGVYNASSDNADGYSSVTVNVPMIGEVTFNPVLIFDEQGIGSTGWTATDGVTTLSINDGRYSEGAVVGEYVEATQSNPLRFNFPTASSYRCFGIKCAISPDFVPIQSNVWYGCSCILGQELGGEQRDLGIIIDKDGYFALGWANSSITSTNIYALDGQVHTLMLFAETGTLHLYIDGTEVINFERTMLGSNMTSIGVFWNNAGADTRVYGKIYSIGCWEPVYPETRYIMPTF